MPIGAGTSGGSAQDVRAGGAYVEVYAKDNFTKKLDAIKASSKAQIMGLSKLVGGFALVDIAHTAGVAAMGMGKFNQSMEEGARITARLEEAQAKLREQVLAKVGGKVAMPVELITDAPGRIDYLKQKLEQAQKNLTGVGQAAKNANDKVTELNDSMANNFIEKLPFAGHALEVDRRKAKAEADELNAKRKALQDQVLELQQQLAAQEPAMRAAWSKPIEDQIHSLRELTATLGMTAREAAVFKAKMDAVMKGIKPTGGLLDQLDFAYREADKAKSKQELKDLAKSLEEALNGVPADERKLHELLKERDELKPMLGRFGGTGYADKRMPQLEKEIATLRGLLAMKSDVDKMKQADDFLKDRRRREAVLKEFGGNVGGTFSGDSRSLGTIGQFQRDALPEKVDETNSWLKAIFGEVSGPVAPVVIPPFNPPLAPEIHGEKLNPPSKEVDPKAALKDAFDARKRELAPQLAAIDAMHDTLRGLRIPTPFGMRGVRDGVTAKAEKPADLTTLEQYGGQTVDLLKRIDSRGGLTFK